jgi:hypothetical protein
MPSHKVTLTDKGFKSLSTDFIIDCLAGFILFSVVVSHTVRHTNNLVLFGFFMLVAIGVYIFYRTKFIIYRDKISSFTDNFKIF